MVKFNFFNQLDIWIFTINDPYRETAADLLLNDELRSRTDFRQTYSDFCILNMPDRGGPFLVKKIKCQIAADRIRRYLGLSQAMREFRSSLLLERLKVSCPPPVMAGTNISPMGMYESLLLCRYLPHHVNGLEFLKQCSDPPARKNFLSAVAGDLAVIHGNGLFHKDTNFSNILCNPQDSGRISWIDNDVKKTGSEFDDYEKLALKRFQKAMVRENLLNNMEWDFFVECYRKNMGGR
jgi:tRNA A-37 threonylcarbamoyl transferase component Bud32